MHKEGKVCSCGDHHSIDISEDWNVLSFPLHKMSGRTGLACSSYMPAFSVWGWFCSEEHLILPSCSPKGCSPGHCCSSLAAVPCQAFCKKDLGALWTCSELILLLCIVIPPGRHQRAIPKVANSNQQAQISPIKLYTNIRYHLKLKSIWIFKKFSFSKPPKR